jgi:hypothetical protein
VSGANVAPKYSIASSRSRSMRILSRIDPILGAACEDGWFSCSVLVLYLAFSDGIENWITSLTLRATIKTLFGDQSPQ